MICLHDIPLIVFLKERTKKRLFKRQEAQRFLRSFDCLVCINHWDLIITLAERGEREGERLLLYNLVLSKPEKVVKSKQQQAFKSCYFSQKVITRVQNSNAHNNRLSLLFEQKLLRQHFNKQAIVYETFLSLTTVTVNNGSS